MTQQKQVIKYFKENKNKPMHFKNIANELNILVPNMRRILGQGTLKGIFTRVSKGVYKLNDLADLSILSKVSNKATSTLKQEELEKELFYITMKSAKQTLEIVKLRNQLNNK